MIDLNITETVVPETLRAEKPNPFAGHFPTAEGKAITVTLPNGTDEEIKTVEAVVRDARREGTKHNTTTRVKRETFREKNKQYVTLTFWSVDAIKRPRGENTATSKLSVVPEAQSE